MANGTVSASCFRSFKHAPERRHSMATYRAPFSIRRFLLQVAVQLIGLFLLMRYAWPDFWAHQIAGGVGPIIVVFLGVHLFVCFFEWWFHRYVLHATIHPWLIRFSRGHRNHHALTAIQLRRNEAGPGRIVLNKYPITSPEQNEDAAFPIYALVAFWAIFTIPFAIVQFLLPHAPIFLGGYAAVAWSLSAYEIFHAIEHYPYEWWERALNNRRFGWAWRKLYGFHHYHHANISWNEAISGFFGLPIADWVFKTYFQPKNLLLSGRLATIRDFHPSQQPWRWVVWLDQWAKRRESSITHLQT